MHVINREGIIIEHIYSSHDRFLEDIDDYINENFNFRVSKDNSIDLLDVVCGHLLHWQYKTYQNDEQAKLVYNEKFKENEILKRFINNGDPTPELVLYEFKGISMYYDFSEDDIENSADFETFTASLENGLKLSMSKEEFAEMGGEIILPEEEGDEVIIEFSWPSGDVYFFMKKEDEKAMSEYLVKSIVELNTIYASLDLPLINEETQM
ncbi:MAG: hypothetical protein RL308_514 [Bacteroidota bacterium]|jgi:hypothetical protein